ncbi:serine hydrolase [Pedobacter yulinensis]|uniref:Serine hydrolase n=1 Tax=Pedobacter yulinensis TaxID=2126353 RepID=A0A2T3HM93_9SPHI|nr:serine hydrolase domain-containing protein [Pedobacter yulinensis]PST83554.1 serine hydrolase [Pedobacter yulinensis]
MFKRFFTALLAVFITAFSALQVRAQAVPPAIDSIMKKFDAVGLSVAVVKKGKLVYTGSFGWKNREQQLPLKDQDIFRIASISKSFSATSIMQLADAGKVSLDDDFSKLIGFKVRNPKFPETVITLRMVLSHTSSLNDSQGYFTLDVIDPAKNPNAAKCYNDYEPGKGYQYCNLNFNMVGTVIEKVSGERFDQYVKRHILDPLKLYGGYCVDSLDKNRFVTLYEWDGKTKTFTPAPGAYNPRSGEIRNYVMGYSTPVFSPTGGMKISAGDLARYMIMHMNYGKTGAGRILSKKSAVAMQTPVSDGEGGYGLALRSANDLVPGKKMTGHTGSAYGLYSSMFFDPKEKFGFVTITNGCNPVYNEDMPQLTRDLIAALYREFIAGR